MTAIPVDLAMSLALDYDAEPKVFCADQRIDKWGRVAVTCRLHKGHAGPHIDVHAGRRWV